jgi:hypothetical protein
MVTMNHANVQTVKVSWGLTFVKETENVHE